jgi:hypothetical protein
MLSAIPEGVFQEVISFVGPQTILPLIISQGLKEFEVCIKGGRFVITMNYLFMEDGIQHRTRGKKGISLPDIETTVSWLAYKMVYQANKEIREDPGAEGFVKTYFLGYEQHGNVLELDEIADPNNVDEYNHILYEQLEHDLSMLGKVSVFD